MRRVEIICNQSVGEDIKEWLDSQNLADAYTLFHAVRGKGRQGTRSGDDLWPEINELLVIYCTDEKAVAINRLINKLKQQFPKEGIKCFQTIAVEVD